MAISSIQISIGLTILSLSVGFLIYYLVSDFAKEKKKIYMEKILGKVVNFILFIWIGKILLNFPVFIVDPLVILSYPSNSHVFYLAILLSVITIVIQSKRKKVDVFPFLNAVIHILLVASFVYEFMQMIRNHNAYSIEYMGLVALLMVAILVMRHVVPLEWLNLLVFFGWSLGSLGLAVLMPIMTVFGYTMTPWFLLLILLVCCLLMVHQKRKEVG